MVWDLETQKRLNEQAVDAASPDGVGDNSGGTDPVSGALPIMGKSSSEAAAKMFEAHVRKITIDSWVVLKTDDPPRPMRVSEIFDSGHIALAEFVDGRPNRLTVTTETIEPVEFEPFGNFHEFWPFRDRWITSKSIVPHGRRAWRPAAIGMLGLQPPASIAHWPWATLCKKYVWFDPEQPYHGTPVGVMHR